MGRIPKPSALRAVQGNAGHRPLNKREPKPDAGVPEIPKWLSKAARKIWKQTVPILVKMKVLTRADGEALGSYCQACARLAQAEAEVEKNGITVLTMKGEVKTNPAVTIADKAMKMKRVLGSDFGLAPASRARLKTEHGEETEDPMDLLLRKKAASAATQ
jgi:P27 family predicted phage terminase small subunit